MADALLSPAVGVALWFASGAALAGCSRRVRGDDRDYLVPLMGVLGAFVFAAQMINFAIPGTGSSGHIGGGLLLSILLGPPAAFVVIASVLTVQALFFADGGLLALGANIFNLGIFPCFIGFPLVYMSLLKRSGKLPSARRITAITLLAAVISLQLGALGVVTETWLSGISNLPMSTFLLLMQPIHLAIGLIEGLATAALIVFVRQARPDLFSHEAQASGVIRNRSRFPTRLITSLALMAVLTGGLFSWFASTQPDGLEWSLAKASGRSEPAATALPLHGALAQLQKRLAMFPHYQFAANTPESSVDAAKSLSGLIGGLATLVVVVLTGYLLKRRNRRGRLQSKL